MIRPNLDQVKELAAGGSYGVVPISTEILSDIKTPIAVLRILKNISGHCYLLESVADREKWGRYTFLGFDPRLELTCQDGRMKVGMLSFESCDPGKYIRQVLEQYRSPRFDYLPSFTGGLVGYFSYDYLKYAEPSLRLDGEDTENFKDVDLMLFDKVMPLTNFQQKIILIVNMELTDLEENYNKAVLELEHLKELIRTGVPCKDQPGHLSGEITPLFDKERYCAMVERAKYHIREGDIFQIVLSNRLEAPFTGSLLNAYRVLRTLNPSPYMFYFSSSDMEVAGPRRKRWSSWKTGCSTPSPCRNPSPGEKRRGGPGPGGRAAGRPERIGGTQYAGGSGTQRYWENQPVWHGRGGTVSLYRAVFPRNAHRVHCAGGDSE